MRRQSINFELEEECTDLTDFLGDFPPSPASAIGGFADVYKVRLGSGFVAVKSIRWFTHKDDEKEYYAQVGLSASTSDDNNSLPHRK